MHVGFFENLNFLQNGEVFKKNSKNIQKKEYIFLDYWKTINQIKKPLRATKTKHTVNTVSKFEANR